MKKKIIRFIRKNKKRILMIFAIIIVLLTIYVLFFGESFKLKQLEKEMTKLVEKYYKENVAGKVIGIQKHVVSLASLENADYNIDKLVDPKTKEVCDITLSYSYVIVDDPNEADIEKIKYEIENHLVCGEYTSKN